MSIFTEIYIHVSRRAGGYGLSCARIVQKRETARDRRNLVELGDDIVKALRPGCELNDESYHGCFMGSLQGILLAVMVEEDWLKTNKCYGEYAEDLRAFGIDSLDKLADVLKKAEDESEFDRYAPHLKEFFNGWDGWAKECYALEKLPLHSVSSFMGFGDAIGKVMARQNA